MSVRVEEFSISCRAEGLVGASFSSDEDELLLTYAKDGIKVVNVFDGRSVFSVLPPNGERFTSKAIAHRDNVFAVLDGHTIFWVPRKVKGNDSRPNLKRVHEAKATIQHVFTSEKCRDLFILSSNGQVDVFDPTGNREIFSFPSTDVPVGSILSSELTHLRGASDISGSVADVFILSRDSNEFSVELISFFLFTSPSPKFTQRRWRSKVFHRPASVKVVKSDSGFTSFHVSDRISILWAGGIWQVFCFRILNDEIILEEQFIREVSLLQNKEPQIEKQESSQRKRKESSRSQTQNSVNYSSFPIQSSFLGLLKAENDKCCVTIWDQNYGTLVKSQTFSIDPKQEFLLVESINKKKVSAAMIFSDSITILPVFCTLKSNLASVIGGLNQSEQFLSSNSYKNLTSPPISISARMEKGLFNSLSEQSSTDAFMKILLERDAKEREVISKLLDIKATPSAKHFHQTLKDYLSSIVVQGVSSVITEKTFQRVTPTTDMRSLKASQIAEKRAIERKKRLAHDDHNISFNFLTSVMGRCLSECEKDPESGFWDSLSVLIATHYCSSRQFPTLLPLIMKHHKISLLADCLRFVHDISEFHLIQFVQFFLQPSTSSELRTFLISNSPEASSFSHHEMVEIALNMVVRKPTSDMFLRPALEVLSGGEVVHLMAYLRNRVCGTPLVAYDCLVSILPGFKYPSVSQGVVWLTALLDVKLQVVLCSKECSSFLLDLSVLIQEQVQITSELRSVGGQVMNLLHRREGQPMKKDYAIETFTF